VDRSKRLASVGIWFIAQQYGGALRRLSQE
jgi:hypothetical protein